MWSLASVGSHSAAVKNWLSCNHEQAAEGCISGPSSPLDNSHEDIQWATACPSFTFSDTSEAFALSTCSLHGLFSGPFRCLKWLDPFIPWKVSDSGTAFWEQDFQQWHSLNGILKPASVPRILKFGSKEVIGTVVAIKFLSVQQGIVMPLSSCPQRMLLLLLKVWNGQHGVQGHGVQGAFQDVARINISEVSTSEKAVLPLNHEVIFFCPVNNMALATDYFPHCLGC